MTDKKTVGSVTYTQTDKDYFAKRGLRRYARVWSLWALGVGAVISGPLLGLEFRPRARLRRHADRPVHHRRDVLGPDLQHRRDVAGVAAHRRGLFVRAQRARALGRHVHRARGEHRVHPDAGRHRVLHRLVHDGDLRDAGRRAAVVVGRGVRRVPAAEPARRRAVVPVSVFVTLGALAVLAIYWVSAMPHFDFNRWALNIGVGPDGAPVELPEGGGSWLPFGFGGALAALPFAVWLFLAIEQLPLAAEESYDPKTDMPKGLIYGMATLMVSALLITFLNSGVGSTEPDKMHGAFSLSTSGRTAARRLPRDLRHRDRQAARVPRGDRPDREFPHDHLCLRPADLFAVARGLLPAVHVGDARHAQGAAHGAVCRAR